MTRIFILAVVLCFASAIQATESLLHSFQRLTLSSEYYCEGAGFGDVSHDGKPDIVSGPYWYAGPEFKTKHEIYPPKPQNRNGYADNFFWFVCDFNADGWNDLFRVGFPGTLGYVYVNPRGAKGHWARHQVFDWVGNESPALTNLVGDARPELVCTKRGQFGYVTVDWENPLKEWTFHAVSGAVTSQKFGHGLGVGDVNGDGRLDIIHKDGWFAQPPSDKEAWKAHKFVFAPRGGAQMFAYDVDGDGDNDIITSLAAHEFGLAWFEQMKAEGDGGGITFKKHLIMGSTRRENKYGVVFSELHATGLRDMDGDGLKDIVTGKTYWSHHKQSPQWNAGAVVYWFKLVRGKDGVDFVPQRADTDSGLGRQVSIGDVNGDGLPDIVSAGMKGTHVLLHAVRKVSAAEYDKAQPKPYTPPALPKGVLPKGENGQVLNLDFEKGTLADWTAKGKAFVGQPIAGEIDPKRKFGEGKTAKPQGNFWLGGFEKLFDMPTGTLTSAVFQVTHPFAAFRIGGGNHKETRVELIRADSGQVFFKMSGRNSETMRPVVMDLRAHAGKSIFIRVVDEHTGGYGHVNFDDFRFYAKRPRFANAVQPPKPLVFEKPLLDGATAGVAAKAMKLPPGFRAIASAAEPDVMQPIAFTLDHRGRMWVAEAYSYPHRQPADKARDRIIILEDTNGDHKFDQRKVFIEGLNLVSGLEVGFGGVWVGAAPNFMFIPDRDSDDRPDGKPQILLDGWGYQDTHETLNSFIWGPDGWLYGCHGVFTHSRVGKPGTADDDRVPFNAGVWRYHPTRHTFEAFAQGTSNPWGVDFNAHGQCFIEACVIPHFFHMIQGGRYQRQGGQHFNPHTYDDIKTIADHLHYAGNIRDHAHWGKTPGVPSATAAAGGGHAHAGLMIYLGDSWPAQYRGQAFMNNIHGARINMDVLKPRGSGYIASHGADFVQFNDRWSQIINLRYDHDGSVYLIDWYDKNQCHSREPDSHDRSNGRVFKVVYQDEKRTTVDLAKRTHVELVKLQTHPNDWYARHARRALQERLNTMHRQWSPVSLDAKQNAAAWQKTRDHAFAIVDPILKTQLATGGKGKTTALRLRALWCLHGIGGLVEADLLELLKDRDAMLRGWAIQLLCENKRPSAAARGEFARMAREDKSPIVRMYLASALTRTPVAQRAKVLSGLLSHAEDATDPNLPHLYWYATEPVIAANKTAAIQLLAKTKIPKVRQYITRRLASK
ncbi:MAG: PVC-type heme-binding CxxCH protein [Limisphaerales bacterium]